MATIFVFKEGISTTCNKITGRYLTSGIEIIKEGSEHPTAPVLQLMIIHHASSSIIPRATLHLE
jgi:hypothetical protein